MPYVEISVGVSDSILRQSAMAQSDYPNSSLMTRVATEVGLCPHFGLCVISWHPPRDAKNCHAPNVECTRQQPHAHFGDALTTMHTATNQKAQQSCGSGTDRE